MQVTTSMIARALLSFAAAVCILGATGCSVYSRFAERTLAPPSPRIDTSKVVIKWNSTDVGSDCARLGTIEVIGPVRKLATEWMPKVQKEAAGVGANLVVVVQDTAGTAVDRQTFLTALHPPDAQIGVHGWAYHCATQPAP